MLYGTWAKNLVRTIQGFLSVFRVISPLGREASLTGGIAAGTPTLDRQQRMRCKRCGSDDIWRVSQKRGPIAEFMAFRKMKPFQCRSCLRHFYCHALRIRDSD